MDIVDPVVIEGESYEEEDEQLPPVRLKEGIEVKELMDNESCVFEVNMDFAEKENQPTTYFNKEELLKCSKFDCICEDEEGENMEPGKTPFEKIASKMAPITEDGKVKKKELQPGHGCVVPPEACVTIHYNGYVEYGDEPFDSSWLRGVPFKFRLQRGIAIPGLDIAVATMKKGECSRFFISSELAYGKFGCPPRIPPNADVLFEVELLNFEDNVAAEAFEALSLEDRQKQSFDVILKAVAANHKMGNDLFKKEMTPAAIQKYKKAVDMLEKTRLKNEDEEKQQQKYLCKLYVNLGICYNKQKVPKLACVMCKEALRIEPMNAKALFNFGKALVVLSDYKEARRKLLAAQKVEPDCKAITEELIKLDKKQKTYKDEVKIFSQRAFKNKEEPLPNKESKTDSVVSDKFVEAVTDFMKDFKEATDKKQAPIPSGLTAQEEACVRQKAEELQLSIRTQECRGDKLMFLYKPEEIKKDWNMAQHVEAH